MKLYEDIGDCFTCKWRSNNSNGCIFHSCYNCKNAKNVRCNCLKQIKDDEEVCPYYVCPYYEVEK